VIRHLGLAKSTLNRKLQKCGHRRKRSPSPADCTLLLEHFPQFRANSRLDQGWTFYERDTQVIAAPAPADPGIAADVSNPAPQSKSPPSVAPHEDSVGTFDVPDDGYFDEWE